MALNTLHINSVAGQNDVIKRFFIGTFPSCLVKYPPQRKIYSFVTNTGICSSSGYHWNGWFVKNDTVIFFDSFGRSPMDQSLPHQYRDIISRFKRFRYFKYAIQPIESFTCGYYTIHFLYVMSFGLDFSSLFQDYSYSKHENDKIVINIIESII